MGDFKQQTSYAKIALTGSPGGVLVDLDAETSGVLPASKGGTGSSVFTLGSVVFAGVGGVYSEDNSNFFWDNTSKKLVFGGDVNIFRSAADVLKTDDSFIIGGTLNTHTIPSGTDTFSMLAATQILTNKTLTTPTIGDFSNASHNHQDAGGGAQLDHGLAITGLTDDDHTIYALLAGRSGGQTIKGGTVNAELLRIQGSSAVQPGPVEIYVTHDTNQGTIINGLDLIRDFAGTVTNNSSMGYRIRFFNKNTSGSLVNYASIEAKYDATNDGTGQNIKLSFINFDRGVFGANQLTWDQTGLVKARVRLIAGNGEFEATGTIWKFIVGSNFRASLNSTGLRLGDETAAVARLDFKVSTIASGGINFGGDTTLYRSAVDVLKTDDSFIVNIAVGIGITPVTGTRLTLPQEDDAVTPTLAFGDGDSGFYESIDDSVVMASAGVARFQFNGAFLRAVVAGGSSLLNETASATNPSVIPNHADVDTGLGTAAANQLSLIAGGIEGIRVNTVASGVNFLDVIPSATTNAVLLGVEGTDTNINLQLIPKGTGGVGIGVTPTSILSMKMGTGTGQAQASGKANVNTTALGTSADTAEKDLITYSLPVNSLSANGKLVRIIAWGTTAANGNEKTIRLYFGSAVVRQLGSAAFNNQDWIAEAIVVRTGASAQDSIGTEITNNNNVFLTHLEPAEDTTAAIIIKVTGQNGSAVANDIVAEGILIEYLN